MDVGEGDLEMKFAVSRVYWIAFQTKPHMQRATPGCSSATAFV